jgi:dipeptidyl aminopeptidase/acylaminoacyl peptidase
MGLNFSADGKRLVYVDYPGGALWRSNPDGSERLQLTSPPMFVVQPRWSPDGRRIAFMGQEPGMPWSIYVISADGGSPQQPAPPDYGIVDPNWIDANTLLFGHNPADESRAGDAFSLETVDLRTRILSRVPGTQNLWSPRWSPDGRHILALTRIGQKLILFDTVTRIQKKLTDVGAGYPEWSRDGAYIYFVSIPPRDQPRAVVRIRIRDGKLEQLMTLKDFHQPPGWGDWCGLDPDDSPLLLSDAGTQDIYALAWEAP